MVLVPRAVAEHTDEQLTVAAVQPNDLLAVHLAEHVTLAQRRRRRVANCCRCVTAKQTESVVIATTHVTEVFPAFQAAPFWYFVIARVA